MTRAWVPGIVVALALATGACAKKSVAPEPPAPTPPPGVLATQPAAFATGVSPDAEIWARFDRPLDLSSVDSTTVYLKVDTRRQSVIVRYEPFSRRVQLTPRNPLSLLQTYTVEFSPELRDTGGVRLGATRFFQFTTGSLRRPRYDFPARGELESPYATLSWGITAASGASVTYDLYADTDSLAVQERRVAALQRNPLARFFPRVSWPRGTRVYWSVRATNTVNGDRSEGDVMSFDTYGPGDAVDSLVLAPADWSGIDPSRFQSCTFDRVWTGPALLKGSIRFPLVGRPELRLASARLELHVPPEFADSIAAPGQSLEIWPTTANWNACGASLTGNPLPDLTLPLGTGVPGPTPRSIEYSGDVLTAFWEAQARRTGFFGPMLQSTQRMAYWTTTAADPADRPRLVLVYYRPRTNAAAVASR